MLPSRPLYEQEIARHWLALREALVRHDENQKAWWLCEATPFFLEGHPEVQQAIADQREMVKHLLEPEAYEDYYQNNPHERPFELQYGITPEECHEYLPRVAWLRKRLENVEPSKASLLDLSANDGFVAVNLGQMGYTVDCVDLHPGNCKGAENRKAAGAKGIGKVQCSDLHDLLYFQAYWGAILFETLEHVIDPSQTLHTIANYVAPGGKLFVSTPWGSVTDGNLPTWAHVERKGHVRVYTPESLTAALSQVGKVEDLSVGSDRVLCAEVTVG